MFLSDRIYIKPIISLIFIHKPPRLTINFIIDILTVYTLGNSVMRNNFTFIFHVIIREITNENKTCTAYDPGVWYLYELKQLHRPREQLSYMVKYRHTLKALHKCIDKWRVSRGRMGMNNRRVLKEVYWSYDWHQLHSLSLSLSLPLFLCLFALLFH